MMKWLLGAWMVVLLAGLAGLGWVLFGSNGREAPVNVGPVAADALADPSLIARGAYLATAGGCAGCHSIRGEPAYAGGREVPTPFGGVPASNLTPDPETGLGHWTFADFWGALHEGKALHGKLLYPAFPYTSYTLATPDDALAIFAYLKSLPAVHRKPAASGLAFPYSVRASLAAWRALYFKPRAFQPDATQTASWNRGAYLVEGLGHCNECHAKRGALGGITSNELLTGGRIPRQDWYAPDLSTRANGGLEGWSEQDVVDLLKTGQSAKGAAFGPMADVVAESTQHLSDADLHAIATYLASLPSRAPRPAPHSAFNVKRIAAAGQKIYEKQCADCHGRDGNGVAGVYPPLNGNSSVTEPSGVNAVRTVLLGGFPPVTAAHPRPYSMPPFAQELNDSDVALVVSYIRQAWTNQSSIVRPEQVATLRHTPIR